MLEARVPYPMTNPVQNATPPAVATTAPATCPPLLGGCPKEDSLRCPRQAHL